MKKIIAILMALVLSMTICATATPVNYGDEIKNAPKKTYEQKFSDVPKDYWAFEYISELVEKKVLSGYPDGMFRPDDIVQRAEFAKIMVGASGLKVQPATTSSFADVKISDWYCPYIETAKNYLAGFKMPDGSIIYAPEVAALREDIAVALIKLKGYDVSVADLGMLKTMFSDYEGISAMARPYVAVAVERGLISGYPDGTFRAQASIARAEAATLLWRSYQYGNDNKVVAETTPATTKEPITTTTPTAVATPEPTATPTPQPIVTTAPTATPKPYFVETIAKKGISNVESMAVDGNNNLYFLDDNKVKKYDGKAVETVVDCSTLKYTYNIKEDDKFKNLSSTILENVKTQDEENLYSYDLTKYNPVSIVYNPTDNKVYLLGCYYCTISNNYYTDYSFQFSVVYSIESIPKVFRRSFDVTKDNTYFMPTSNDISIFKNDKLYYSVLYDGFIAQIKYIENDNNGYDYADTRNGAESVNALSGEAQGVFVDNIFKLLSIRKGEIWSYDISSKTFKSKNLADKFIINGSGKFEGNFYISNALDVYKVDTKGQVTEFIRTNAVEITDDLPVAAMGRFIFDNNQNIIFFDSTNHAIRKINKR